MPDAVTTADRKIWRDGHLGEGTRLIPEETAIALRTHGDGTRWLHTGDLGRVDEDGYVFIVDRQKDLIKTSGYQVWPREIEEAIASHPAVAEVNPADEFLCHVPPFA